MKRIRVLLTKNFFPEDLEYMKSKLLDNVELVAPNDFSDTEIANAASKNIHVLLGDVIKESILDKAESLQLIQIPWTGVDRLNFKLLKNYNISICNSHSNAEVVAEYAVSLMFSIVKKIPFHDAGLRKGNWYRPQRGSNNYFTPPDMLKGKTMGFLGYGAISKAITRILSGLSLQFIGIASQSYDPPPSPLFYLGGPEDIDYILRTSDVIFVALPVTNKTIGLIDKDKLSKMKYTAYLINVSRGNIIVEGDLYRALKEKQIEGAAIDAWYNYPTPSVPEAFPSVNYPFHELDNIVLSPHRAGFAKGLLPHLDDAIENINRFASEKQLINQIDLDKNY